MQKNKFFVISLVLLLVISVLILLQVSGISILTVRTNKVDRMRVLAMALGNYMEKTAADLGVDGYPSVRRELASYVYDLQRATTTQSILGTIFRHIQTMRDTIVREAEHKQRQAILLLINDCINKSKGCVKPSVIEILRGKKGKVVIKDPSNILSRRYLRLLKEILSSSALWQNMKIKVSERGASFVVKISPEEQYKALSRKFKGVVEELVSIKKRCGLLPLSGEGIVVKMYDASSVNTEEGIIHDSDVRDLVNELWAAGAIGIEVGGERLITSSSIRCIGPAILVNNHPIVVNPITIKAVGNPEVLKSSLSLIKNHLKLFGVNIEIKIRKRIELSRYRH